MSQKTKTKNIQIFITLSMLTIALLAILIILALVLNPHPAAAMPPSQATGQYVYYLPIVSKYSTPTPSPVLYYDDFLNKKSGWPRNTGGSCRSEYESGAYGMGAMPNKDCYRAAPQKAQHRFGVFKTVARRIPIYYGDTSTKFSYGIYINERNSREDYYLFRVGYDDDDEKCWWDLIRRKDKKAKKVKSGKCKSKGFNFPNTLAIKHTSDGSVSVYLNGQQLGLYYDNAPLTGQGTGLYLEEQSNDKYSIVVFDEFRVNSP
jgi:hypothetical protein